jgi:anaerobic sulfite reductase subunit B
MGNCGGSCHCDEKRLERKDHGTTLLFDPVKTTIVKKQKMGRDYFMRVKAPVNYEPGQFFQLTVLGFGEAPISIASWDQEYIDFIINPVGTVTKEMVRKKVGDTLLIRGPYGYGYPMHYFHNNTLLLIGGGCGVAPLKGVMEYIAKHRGHYRDVHCFYGYRTPGDSLFTKEFEQWENDGTFTFHYAYSSPPPEFKGPKGYVTNYIESSGLDNRDKAALICGPPPMMLAAIDSLKKLGFNDDQIWISHERHMKCATGMCGHCMIEGKYTCKDGPVFRWDWIKESHG